MSNGSVFAFWFLNHRLKPPELRRQLAEMKAQGFAGVFPHPRAGLQTPYLSREWFDCMRLIARECRRLGLEFWLYDEDPFPSGAGGGRVMLDHPEFARCALAFEEHAVAGDGEEIIVDFQGEKLVSAFALRLNGGKPPCIAADLTECCGLVRAQWTGLRRRAGGYYPPYKNLGRKHWRTGTAGVNWRMQARLRAGKYLIVGVFSQRQEYNTWGALPDLLNPAAVEYFMKITHESYCRELGPELFATVRGIFTDEAKVTGDYPWTDALPDRFRHEYGEDIRPLLPHLKYDLNTQTLLVRHRYRRLLGKMFRTAFVKPIFDWCARRRIQSTGHFSPEENPIGQQAMTPDLMEWLLDMQLPGIDLIGADIGTRDFCIINIGPKLVCSAARQAGRPQVLAESLGVSGEDLSLARAKSMLDWQMVLGVNKFALHGQFYSLDGPRKREAPPSIFETAPYWPYFKKLVDYLETICRRLRQGRRLCSLAVLYPTTHINVALPGAENKLSPWRQALGELVYWLQARGFDFDFVSEPGLAAARCGASSLRVGHCSYKVLLVPDVALVDEASANAMRRLRIPLVFIGSRPWILETGRRMTGIGRVCGNADVESILAPLVPRHLTTVDGCDLFCQSRAVGRRTYHFVFNPVKRPLRCGLAVASRKWLNRRDDQSGAFLPMCKHKSGGPALDLPPLGAALLCESASTPARLEKPARTVVLQGPWMLKPCGDNTLLLDRWRDRDGRVFRLPLPYDVEQLPLRPILQCRFFVKSSPAAARLVWEEGAFGAPCVLTLNGRQVKGARRRVYDAHNIVADVAHWLRLGWNVVTARFLVEATPPMHDPLRLMGRFRVMARGSGFAVDAWRAEMPLRTLTDWNRLGWPFYSGTMVYTAEFDLPPSVAVTRLRIDGLHDLAAVEVNGKLAGVVAWPPYRCDISRFVRSGRNRLCLRVANSFVNFIDGARAPAGITGGVTMEET
ncbi:MAG: glycosyl hydrolase [Kiritimatiellae bacterium]|nr:glycosyl hydrolase [Kiritimatiellia bacterium]